MNTTGSASFTRSYPLLYAQQRLWFLSELAPGNPFYNVPGVVRISGRISVAALAQSVGEIVRRHGTLRTRFRVEGREPAQVVSEDGGVALEVADLRSLDAGERDAVAEELGRGEATRSFDLGKGPMLRARLLLLGEGEYVLLVTLHHIISDGWSHGVFVKELSRLYESFAGGEPSRLAELEVQYSDYAVWQREWLKGEVYQKQLSYWREQLRGLGTLDLPTDRPRPAAQSFRGGFERTALEAGTARRLRELARREGVTLYMALLAGFAALLQRYTGQQDIVIGTPIANRNRKEIEGLIGFFVNSLVLRLEVGERMRCRDLLRHVKQVCLEAFANQDLPFERLVDELHLERDPSRNPLFQVMFVMTNVEEYSPTLRGARCACMVRKNGTSKFDLQLIVRDITGQLEFVTEYSSDLYEAATVRRMMKHYVKLLEGMAEDVGKRVGAIGLLGAEEWEAWREWNRTETVYRGSGFIHEQIGEQGRKRPDAVAVVFGEDALTYAELNRRANRLAHWLVAHRIGPEQVVGVGMARSLELVVCLLGVLKAGGGYLPLDSEYPEERLRRVVEDAGARLVIADAGFAAGESRLGGAEVARWEDVEREMAGLPGEAPEVRLEGDNLIYVIFTSGSTGTPKGAINTHAGLWNRLQWMQQEYGLEDSDRILQKTPFSFDVSGWEFHWPLMFGACLEVAEPWGHHDPAYLARHIRERGVTTAHFVPSMYEFFLEEEGARECVSLRRIICSGEALRSEQVKRHYEVLGAELHNLYGPTEASIDVTYWRCEREWNGGKIPIGRPIANTEIWILDGEGNVCPAGVRGEIWIGGVGLGRGYAGRAELTAGQFAPHPVAGHAGQRLYRTGDVGEWGADGEVRYWGRADNQVKIRGLRIEPGEIEELLNQHEWVQQNAVLARGGSGSDSGLIAYVVPRLEGGVWGGREGEKKVEKEQVSQWREVFEENYGESETRDYRFDITGWKSSYTGLPIPEEEMRDWVEETIRNIKELKAERILEIGCGTGLLLWRLAGEVREYLGTDFSERAIARLRRHVERVGWEHVRLEHREAKEFAELEAGHWDVVVLNSVVQYFPQAEYLEKVIEGSLQVTGEQGRVFIGDVRSLPLLETFLAGVEVSRSADTGRERLRQNVRRRMNQEEELVLDPGFFLGLKQRYPCIGRVEIRVRRSRFRNELTCYRYDVVLHKGAPGVTAAVEWRRWRVGELTAAEVRRMAQAVPADRAVGIRGIRNARLEWDLHVREWLEKAEDGERVGERYAGPVGLDPAEVWAAGESAGCRVWLSWAVAEGDGSYDAVLSRNEAVPEFPEKAVEGICAKYANQPLRGRLLARLEPELREYLRSRLPAYMLPRKYVIVDRLPLNRNGKLDRRALEAAAREAGAEESRTYVEPATVVEKILAEIWREVLGRERIGALDSFFEVGGNSLLATQAVSRARAALRRDIPLRQIFETPTVRGFGEWIGRQPGESGRLGAGPGRDESGTAEKPLSYAQQRLWFLAQLAPGNAFYNVPGAARIRGALSVPALEQSLREIVRRHETLRTRFEVRGEGPVQVVAGEAEVRLEITDLRGVEAEARRAAAAELSRREARRGFDLARGPLLRARLLLLDGEDYLLLLTMHHIVSDGWSHGILLREQRELYERFAAGAPSQLAELALQYGDYAVWQRQWLQGEVYQQQMRYWREQLRGMESLSLPTDFARPAAQSFSGGLEQLTIDEEVTEGLRELARSEGVTLYMVLLAGFAALLHRYSGQSEVVTGAPIANRNRAEIENLIGFFVNTLILRIRVREDISYRQLLQEVREICLGAYNNQDLPFERLVDEIQPGRDLSRTPLVQVVFVMLNAISADRKLGEAEFIDLVQGTGTAKFDLQYFVREINNQLQVYAEYSADIFKPERIRRALQDYAAILWQAARCPSVAIGNLSILTKAERAALAGPSGESQHTPYSFPSLPDLLREQVRSRGDSIAVWNAEQSVTWSELWRRAERLGGRITAAAGGAATVVAISVEDDLSRLIAILSVVAAGCAYVLIDTERSIEMTWGARGEGHWTVFLTDAPPPEDLVMAGIGSILFFDSEGVPSFAADSMCSRMPDHADLFRIAPHGGAGTAAPSLEYGAMRDLARWWSNQFAMTMAGARCCVALDASWGEEAVCMLCAGGSLLLAAREHRGDASRLAELIKKERIESLLVPARLLKPVTRQLMLLDLPEDASLAELLVVGTDGYIDSESWAWLRDRGCVVWLLYGTAETPLVFALPMDDPQSRTLWPRAALKNPAYQPMVIGPGYEPVAQDGIGEICVRGVGLSRGYLGCPERTAEAFIPDPMARGRRLFRTGDIARHTADGAVKPLGSFRNVSSLQGVRIALEEIEALIRRCPSVFDAAALISDDGAEDRKLTVFVELQAGSTLSLEALNEYLREFLPSYMLPSAVVAVKQMPTAVGGRIDRERLRSLDIVGSHGTKNEPPRTATEQQVQQIFAEVLAKPNIGVTDDFFELGGHSLLAVRIVSRLQKQFGARLTLREFFAAPTIRLIADRLDEDVLTQTDPENLTRLLSLLDELPGDDSTSMAAVR